MVVTILQSIDPSIRHGKRIFGFACWMVSLLFFHHGSTCSCAEEAANVGQVRVQLNSETANTWAELVLKGIDTEFPNKMSLLYSSADQIRTPRETFPAFYGCYDWHSSVHGHWMLARLIRLFPDMASATRVRATLTRHLSEENLRSEAEFFSRMEQKTYERMYGWAWYLRLVVELNGWDDSDAKRWRESLRPLETIFVERTLSYLPLLTFPIRTGEHSDTGFALGQILDYAREVNSPKLHTLVAQRGRDYYANDRRYPVEYEPSGHDFFSSAWNEADLMRRVLPQDEFVTWLDQFLPDLASQLLDGTIVPVTVSDLTDPKIVHLAGLNLNRAWAMQSVADALPESHPVRNALYQSADAHLQAGIAYVNSGHYEGDHWLATFALYASTQVNAKRPKE